MKRLILCMILSAVAAGSAATTTGAASYKWIDEQGGMHFTDNPASIPLKYRTQSTDLDAVDQGSPVETMHENAVPARQSDTSRSVRDDSGESSAGKGYWQSRFAALRGERKSVQASIDENKGKLNETRRRWLTSQRRSERQAMNQLENEIARGEEKIRDIDKKLEQLDADATRQAVPFEWRN